MTESPPEVNPLAAAYVVGYITLSNIRATPTNNSFTVTFDTDIPCKMAMDYWSQNDPSLPQPLAGSVLEGTTVTSHSITTGALPGTVGSHAGYYFGYSLRLDATDVTGKTLRSQQGMVRLIGARAYAQKTVPVRFNNYGDGTRPANGGGSGQYMSGGGNWSSYTWSQYNPKNTTYPTP